MISFDASDVPSPVIVKQPTPPPALAEVQDLIPVEQPRVMENNDVVDSSLVGDLLQPESPMALHIVRFIYHSLVVTI